MKPRVAWGVTTPQYNSEPPYHPDRRYPELAFDHIAPRPNAPYALLRDLFGRLGLDAAHARTTSWNPLGDIIRSGQTVVIKPNFVLSSNSSGQDLFAMVTHPSILRALVDYAFVALQGTGRIIIADAPQMDCDWEQLMTAQRLDTIQDFYRRQFNFDVELYDLRNFALIDPRQPVYASNRQPRPGDPAGSIIVNLGNRSEFYGRASENYYGADCDRSETIRHHRGGTHEYCVSKTVLAADVFLSVPKMKVHKKVGVTLNLKGLVGINTNKNYLIHHTLGTPSEGGDQLPDGLRGSDRFVLRARGWLFDKALARQSRLGDLMYRVAVTGYRNCIKPFQPLTESTMAMDGGNWHGNDSAWRMTADLAKILFFADADGELHDTPQRKIFCVVDGIIGGENCGPLAPDARPAGCLVVGENPFAVDIVSTRLMGFDPAKIRQFDILRSPDWDFGLPSADEINELGPPGTDFHFKPHPGWVGHIELTRP